MIVYPEIYGADADGNRGQLQYCVELEPSDRNEIRAQIECMYEPGRNDYTIYLYAEQHDIEIEFDVLASDYFTYDELKELTWLVKNY